MVLAAQARRVWLMAALSGAVAASTGSQAADASESSATGVGGRGAAPVPSASNRPAAKPITVDRVAVRWSSPATGGAAKPRFIFARELAFEARIEAMADGSGPRERYGDPYVRTALERHITESMLAALPVDPRPKPEQVAAYAEAARLIVEQRVGSRGRLHEAAAFEGIEAEELNALLRRRARASLYLDRMVAPMLEPTTSDLREVHRGGETPYTDQPFEQIAPQLRRWLVSTRLSAALSQYFRNARGRITLRIIGGASRRRSGPADR